MTDTTNAPAAPVVPAANTHQITIQLVEGRKSLPLSFLLTFFFGPLGLLYVSVTWALIMTVLTFIFMFVTIGLGAIIMWPINLILSLVLASSANSKMQRRMERAAK